MAWFDAVQGNNLSVALKWAPARQFRLLIQRLHTAALDLIFPPRCAGCGRVGEQLCAACQNHMRAAAPLCSEAPPLSGVYAAGLFDGPWRSAIHALKYEGQRTLAPTLAAYLPAPPPDARLDLIVPVPLYPGRERWRGYNQAALLADALGARLGLAVSAEALVRARDTRSQVGLSAQQRRENVSGAFTAARGLVAGRRVLLVDDVVTTGATMAACAEALRLAGAEAVWAVSLACAPPVNQRTR